jgi:hypothetical protein
MINNAAETGSNVGIQADSVINSTVHFLSSDASPERKYEIGLCYLDDGIAVRARELISAAIAHGYDNSEVRLHWLLAMLSKRSLRDLTKADRAQLEQTCQLASQSVDGCWKPALIVVCELIERLLRSHRHCRVQIDRLHTLPRQQRDKIVRHLDLVLTGTMKDTFWAETRQTADEARFANNRQKRVWAYFHPRPFQARTRKPVEDATTFGDRMRALAWTMLAAIALGYVVQIVLRNGDLLAIAAGVTVIIAGYLVVRDGMEWWYRARRMTVKESDHVARPREHATGMGFANQIDRAFDHYFGKYLPHKVERAHWLAETAGIRNTLRDEIVELYREQRIPADRVRWLVGYLAIDVRDKWCKGTLRRHRERYRTSALTKWRCSLAVAVLVPAALEVIITGVLVDSVSVISAVLIGIAGARAAAVRWFHIVSEGRRYSEDHQEYRARDENRKKAYRKWVAKLDKIRPSEQQMETWLNCDQTILLDSALVHYGLQWREIITHAFLRTPGKNSKRRRFADGPWRYSTYNIHLFLITEDGVREVSTSLHFQHVTLGDQKRNNYRFDAVSSVQVLQASTGTYTLELTLFNGPSRSIRIVDAEPHGDQGWESAPELAENNLDSAGFTHALHILEGIAAEGKNWIARDSHGQASSTSRTPESEKTLTGASQ